ncbi:MAG: DUF1580 domain-containing protein [Gemmataceae bacterium]
MAADPITHDLTRETLLSLAQAARRFPPARLGRPVNSSTVWRWARKGVKVPGVGVIRLECVRVSGRWLTSEEAISRFVLAQTPPADSAAQPTPRTPTQRRKASEQAGRQLDEIGI